MVDAAEAVPDLWGRLVAGCRLFLDAGTEPSAARIVLVDGPAVLGRLAGASLRRVVGRHLPTTPPKAPPVAWTCAAACR